MIYLEVKAESAHFCGFNTVGYFIVESKDAFYDSQEFEDFNIEMQEWIDGFSDQWDYEEQDDPLEVFMQVNEITKEEYEEEIKDLNGQPYLIG